jgi:hypothetical protein
VITAVESADTRVVAMKLTDRLRWQQARYQSKTAGGLPRGAVSVLQDFGRLPWHQLFFDRMQLRRPDSPVRRQPSIQPVPAGRTGEPATAAVTCRSCRQPDHVANLAYADLHPVAGGLCGGNRP